MDTILKKYIESNIEVLKDNMYPVHTPVVDRMTIAYTLVPVSGGHVKQSQLTMIVVSPDVDECMDMEKNLVDLLDMDEDEPFVSLDGRRFKSGISGGGLLFNEGCQCYEDTLYFIITWR